MRTDILKPAFTFNRIVVLLALFSMTLPSCRKAQEDTHIHELDKKYISESELFALNKAIENDPDESDNFYKRAKVYLERNESKKALLDVEKAIRLNNEAGRYYYLKARIYDRLHQPDSSLRAAERAESLRFAEAELIILLSRLYLEKGNKEQASRYYNQAQAVMPHHPDVYFLKGKFSASGGDTADALKNYFLSIRLDTNNADGYKELSTIYFNKRKYDSAMTFVAAGKFADPEDPFFPYQEGRLLEKANWGSAAKAFYRSAIRLDSAFSKAYFALGNLLFSQGFEAEAVKTFEKELRVSPEDINVNLRLAEIYQKQERSILAIPLLERVMKSDTGNKAVKMQLEHLYKLNPEWEKPGQVKKDTMQAVKADSSLLKKNEPKSGISTSVKKDTTKKKMAPPAQPKNNKTGDKESSKEIRNFIPVIKNPDSSKIETRPTE